MKPRKLSKTLLAAVLMLSLLVSVFPGFGIASVAGAITWDHSYAVTQNDLSSVTAENSPWADFVLYKWAHTGNSDGYKDSVLSQNVEINGGALKDNANQFRTSANGSITVGGGTGSTDDDGYLNFATDSLKTWAITNTKEAAKVDTDFVMEVTMQGKARVGYRNIVISPDLGKMNLNAGADGKIKGLSISLTDDQSNCTRFVITGAIDPNTASLGNGSANYTPTSQNFSIGKSADKVIGVKPKTVTGVGPGNADTTTYRIEVKDGFVTVYDTDAPSGFLTVKLTDDFAGGYVSYAGTNAYFGATNVDDGAALVSLKWSDVDPENEYNYEFTRNTTSSNVYADDFIKNFSVYRWEFPVSSGVVTGAPTLRTAVAGRGIHTYNGTSVVQLASNRGDNGTSAGYDGGYYSFVRYAGDGDTKADGGKYSDLEWSTSASRTSNFLASFTHRRTLAADEDFYLEMSMLADASSGDANTQAIMIAPKGDFALTQDGVADNGVFISVHAASNWTTVAGAIENSFNDDDVTMVVNGANNTNKSSGNWHRVTRTADVALASQVALGGAIPTDLTFYGNANSTLTAHQGGVVTFCVLVKDGVMSIWNKADSTVMMKLTLTDAYEGGAVSYVGSNFNRGAFAGMYLTTDETKFPAETAGTYAYDTTSQDQAGDALTDEAFRAYLNEYYDLYVDGVKAEGVSDNETGWAANYISGTLIGNYLELKPLTDDDKSSIGALVPKMASKGTDTTASLYASDLEVETSLRLFRADSGDDAGNLPMIGLRMATAGDLTSDGVYVKYVRDASNGKVVLVEINDGVSTETELASGAFHNTANVFPKLYVKLVGTALTGYVQYNYEKIDFSATVSYDEVGYVAFGATAGRVMTDLLKINLIEYPEIDAAANVGDGTLTVNRADTDRAGYFKFIITATPDADAALKAGTLIAEDAEGQMVPKRIGFQSEETQGTQYVVYSKSDVTVSATFYKVTAGNENIAKIGTSVNTAAEGDEGYVGGGLRFVYHADIHQNAENSPYYMTVDGVEKEIADFGAIVALKSTADALNGGLCYENKDAAYVQYRSVLDSGVYYDLCDSYAQFAIQVTNISLLNVENEEITACGYILFADGTAVSTDAFTTSFAAQQ